MRLGFRGGPPQAEPEISTATSPEGPGKPRAWRTVYADAASFLSPGVLAGLFCGLLIGGVGGRLAMFVLRVTSDKSLRGMETDDGFVIGEFTGDTLFLIGICTFLGAAGGLVYSGVRDWLPRRWRPALFALLGVTAGSPLIIRPDGVDFTLLEPRSLAVAMFVLLPAAYGASLSVLTEWLMRSISWRRSRWRWLGVLPLGMLVPIGPFGLAILLVISLVVALNRAGRITVLWRSAPVTWLGRGALALVVVGGSILLARDIEALL